MQEQLDKFENYLRAGRYSKNTIKNYLSRGRCFLNVFQNCDLKELKVADIENFIATLMDAQPISDSYHRQLLDVIKKLYDMERIVLHIDMREFYPKYQKKTYDYLTAKEVKALIASTQNAKHKCIISLLYGSGLRLGELLDLKGADIDFKNNRIRISQTNQRRARIAIFPTKFKKEINAHLTKMPVNDYLFQGYNNCRYTSRSVQIMLKKSALIAGISKEVCPCVLRRSFAIHCLKKGVSIRQLQQLMGHDSVNTTKRYLRGILPHKYKKPFNFLC